MVFVGLNLARLADGTGFASFRGDAARESELAAAISPGSAGVKFARDGATGERRWMACPGDVTGAGVGRDESRSHHWAVVGGGRGKGQSVWRRGRRGN